MEERHFIISYYKNEDSGIHIQKIKSSELARSTHSHEYFQIYYVLRGSLLHVTEGNRGRLVKGDAFVIPPQKTHSVADEEDALFYTFSFTKEGLRSDYQTFPLVNRLLQDLCTLDSLPAKISIQSEEILFVEGLMEKMLREFQEKPLGYIDVIRACAVILLTVLARHHFESAPLSIPQSSNRARILACIKFIDESFAEDLTLGDMAKWCTMSKSEFCKQFSSLSGTTFQKYLHSARIKHAVALLQGGRSASTVYSLCGYNDFSTFHRNFKRIMGCTPLQYRKMSKDA